MLYLGKKDILQAVTMKDVIDAIDNTYRIYRTGNYQMPTRIQVQDGDNTLLLMPGMTQDAIGTKLVTSFPNNTDAPVLHGLVLLNSQENGKTNAIMDGSFLTGFRTGAIGGSAVRHLTDEGSVKLAVIGTGVQGLYQAVAACSEREVTDIYLHNRSPEKIPDFIESLRPWVDGNITIHNAGSAEEAIRHADIIMTATTSKTPVLPDKPEYLSGKLIIGIGSFQPTMREFPQSIYQLSDYIFLDTADAIEESGDITVPLTEGWITKDSLYMMADFIANKNDFHFKNGASIVFKSTGMALFDVVVADKIYKRALEKGVGTILE